MMEQMKNKGHEMYFVENGSVAKFNARGAKLFAEWCGGIASDGVGFVSVYGALGNGFWEWTESNYTTLGAQIESLANNDEVKNIVLLINSPGGMAEGLFDLCEKIKDVDGQKPVYAYITGMACSAAYAIATACRRIYSETDATTGCCGCYAEAFEIDEKAYEKMGWLHKVFRSANAPKKNLSVITNEEAQKEYEASIDAHGEAYLKLCAENRGISYDQALDTFGKGAVVSIDYALENGMVDVVCSLEKALDDITGTHEEDEHTTPTLAPEGEGDKEMDINAMSAEALMSAMTDEQKKELFGAICNENPSLLKEREDEARENERVRLEALNSLRNGTTEVDAIVDSAIADGRDANAIALDVIVAMKTAKPVQDDRKDALNKLLDATTDVGVPRDDSADGTNPYLTAAKELNESKEE